MPQSCGSYQYNFLIITLCYASKHACLCEVCLCMALVCVCVLAQLTNRLKRAYVGCRKLELKKKKEQKQGKKTQEGKVFLVTQLRGACQSLTFVFSLVGILTCRILGSHAAVHH